MDWNPRWIARIILLSQNLRRPGCELNNTQILCIGHFCQVCCPVRRHLWDSCGDSRKTDVPAAGGKIPRNLRAPQPSGKQDCCCHWELRWEFKQLGDVATAAPLCNSDTNLQTRQAGDQLLQQCRSCDGNRSGNAAKDGI